LDKNIMFVIINFFFLTIKVLDFSLQTSAHMLIQSIVQIKKLHA